MKYVEGVNAPSGQQFETRYVSTKQLVKIKIPKLHVRYLLRTSDSYIRVNRNYLKINLSQYAFGAWFTKTRDDWLSEFAENLDGTCRYTKVSFTLPHVSYENLPVDLEGSLTQDDKGRVVLELVHAKGFVVAAIVLDAPLPDETSYMCVQGWKAPSELKRLGTDLLALRNDFANVLGRPVGFDGSKVGKAFLKTDPADV